MASDRFTQTGWRRVADQVGRGTLRGRIKVNQIYAQDQHENPTYSHDDGGMKYLTRPLLANYQRYYRGLAGQMLGGTPVVGMRWAIGDLNVRMRASAPKEHGYLGNSGEVWVYDNGRVAWHRPPVQKRLTQQELNLLAGGP